MVPVPGKEEFKQGQDDWCVPDVVAVLLLSWGLRLWQKLVRLMPTIPLLIRYSIWSRGWSLRCSRLFLSLLATRQLLWHHREGLSVDRMIIPFGCASV